MKIKNSFGHRILVDIVPKTSKGVSLGNERKIIKKKDSSKKRRHPRNK